MKSLSYSKVVVYRPLYIHKVFSHRSLSGWL